MTRFGIRLPVYVKPQPSLCLSSTIFGSSPFCCVIRVTTFVLFRYIAVLLRSSIHEDIVQRQLNFFYLRVYIYIMKNWLNLIKIIVCYFLSPYFAFIEIYLRKIHELSNRRKARTISVILNRYVEYLIIKDIMVIK